ncbi:hypothetical protein C7H19_06880 [Aphanothece hegewaldii CCALA 016]|uniref:PIN-like domain-containing protein n=1 Tax=Aphanothece hegewaldii CCALA 016 TaxID=2107694 RepID=A0A2T1M0J9_9CHRO|nr:PIN domain-containing protein [Aphanothece hegewaldii]PSF38190.1 hypothetical protein C7H19_06880 [Aphanothece hegewaldii CCALA 016]
MGKKLKNTVLLIDYENIQDIDLSIIQEHDIEIKIFVGQSQNKIPIELVLSSQKLGQRVEWIQIEGTGSNSLDFHIAFYLGKLSNNNLSFIILSKDKGFEPLIKYLTKQNINCKRIQSLLEILKQKSQDKTQQIDLTEKVLENLAKINNSRPTTRKTLRHHIKSLLLHEKLSESEIDQLVNNLFHEKKVSEVSNKITYHF